MKIRKGDQVKIISGNEKGAQGNVMAVFPDEEKIIVEGVYVKKKHVRPRRQGEKGELVQMPAPFSWARAMVICASCSKSSRVGQKIVEGRKIRVCKKCGGALS